MFKDIILFALLWMGARFAWGVDMTAFHDEMFRLVAENHASLLGSAFLLVVLIFVFAGAVIETKSNMPFPAPLTQHRHQNQVDYMIRGLVSNAMPM